MSSEYSPEIVFSKPRQRQFSDTTSDEEPSDSFVSTSSGEWRAKKRHTSEDTSWESFYETDPSEEIFKEEVVFMHPPKEEVVFMRPSEEASEEEVIKILKSLDTLSQQENIHTNEIPDILEEYPYKLLGLHDVFIDDFSLEKENESVVFRIKNSSFPTISWIMGSPAVGLRKGEVEEKICRKTSKSEEKDMDPEMEICPMEKNRMYFLNSLQHSLLKRNESLSISDPKVVVLQDLLFTFEQNPPQEQWTNLMKFIWNTWGNNSYVPEKDNDLKNTPTLQYGEFPGNVIRYIMRLQLLCRGRNIREELSFEKDRFSFSQINFTLKVHFLVSRIVFLMTSIGGPVYMDSGFFPGPEPMLNFFLHVTSLKLNSTQQQLSYFSPILLWNFFENEEEEYEKLIDRFFPIGNESIGIQDKLALDELTDFSVKHFETTNKLLHLFQSLIVLQQFNKDNLERKQINNQHWPWFLFLATNSCLSLLKNYSSILDPFSSQQWPFWFYFASSDLKFQKTKFSANYSLKQRGTFHEKPHHLFKFEIYDQNIEDLTFWDFIAFNMKKVSDSFLMKTMPSSPKDLLLFVFSPRIQQINSEILILWGKVEQGLIVDINVFKKILVRIYQKMLNDGYVTTSPPRRFPGTQE